MTYNTTSFKALLLAAALALPGLALADEPAMVKDGFLVDHVGLTLYTYDKDADGKSTCYDTCAKNWPPLPAKSEAKDMGDWKTTERTDGTKQWVYKDKPLYTFAGDKNPGDKTGDGKGGVWHVAKP